MRIQITNEDIQGSGPGVINNPIARALERTTGSKWRMWDGVRAFELSPPFRVLDMPAVVSEVWESYTDLGSIPEFEFEAPLERFQPEPLSQAA